MRSFIAAFAVGLVLMTGVQVYAQDDPEIPPLRVVLDKTSLMTLPRPAASVVVGEPEIADVSVASPRRIVVIGKKVGETSLVVLDDRGRTMVDLSLVVVPETDRHVTIHKGADGVLTLNCDPRCSGVDNPGTEKTPSTGGPAGAAPPPGIAAPGGAGGSPAAAAAVGGGAPAGGAGTSE